MSRIKCLYVPIKVIFVYINGIHSVAYLNWNISSNFKKHEKFYVHIFNEIIEEAKHINLVTKSLERWLLIIFLILARLKCVYHVHIHSYNNNCLSILLLSRQKKNFKKKFIFAFNFAFYNKFPFIVNWMEYKIAMKNKKKKLWKDFLLPEINCKQKRFSIWKTWI